MTDTCETCKFFVEGWCRRYPKTALKRPADWCGEYKVIIPEGQCEKFHNVIADVVSCSHRDCPSWYKLNESAR